MMIIISTFMPVKILIPYIVILLTVLAYFFLMMMKKSRLYADLWRIGGILPSVVKEIEDKIKRQQNTLLNY